MSTHVQDHDALLARVEQLERQNRRWRCAGVAVLIFGALLFLRQGLSPQVQGRAGPGPKVVEAEKFVLKDETGKPRATLHVGTDDAGLTLYDTQGNVRVRLGTPHKGEGPSLYFKSEKERQLVTLSMDEHGPLLALTDLDENPRLSLAVSKDTAALVIAGKDGKKRAIFGEWEGKATIELYGKGEQPLFSKP